LKRHTAGLKVNFGKPAEFLNRPNQLERLAKEVKRRTTVVEVFCGEGAVEKLLCLILSHLDEVRGARSLRGFAGIRM
jgi:transposase-like protein